MNNFIFKKNYGQNFLRDKSVLNKIYELNKVTPKDLIIEIGPGDGALTKKLLNYNCRLICFEIDFSLKEYLDKIESKNLLVIYEDFLSYDIKKLLKDYDYNNLYIIANIPYYITSPIIQRVVELNKYISKAVLMVQKEVAQRICAKNGTREFGLLSVKTQIEYNTSVEFIVKKESFYPIPLVDSAIISLEKRKNSFVYDNNKLDLLLKEIFSNKRKNIKNNLKNYDLEKVSITLSKYNKNLQDRAEDLPIDAFIDLSNVLKITI